VHGQLLDHQRGRYGVLYLCPICSGGSDCLPALAVSSSRSRFERIGDGVSSLPERGPALLYVPARLLEIYGWKPFAVSRVCVRLAMFAFLGVGLGAIVLFGSAYVVLNSPRASGTIPNLLLAGAVSLSTRLIAVLCDRRLATVFQRHDRNRKRLSRLDRLLRRPGELLWLLSLLIFPQAFVGASRRQRILYTFFLLLITCPLYSRGFRYLLWLFQGAISERFPCSRSLPSGDEHDRAVALRRRGKLNLWMLG